MEIRKGHFQENITVRYIKTTDIASIHEIFSQTACFPNTTLLPYPTRDYWRNRLENTPTGEYHLLVEKGDQILGTVIIMAPTSVSRQHTAVFGITIRAEAQGQGIGSGVMEVIIDFCESNLAVNRIELGVNIDNAAAVALYKKFGFHIEARVKKHVFRQGQYIDGYRMARCVNSSSIVAINETINKTTDTTSKVHSKPTSLSVSHALMSEKVIIRHSEADDVIQIQTLYEQTPNHFYGVNLPCDDEEQTQNKILANTHNLVIESQGIVIAHAGLLVGARPRVQHEARLGMVVHESYQNQDFDSQLLSAVIDLAFNWLQLQRLSLMVHVDNHTAIDLYQKHQFVIEGTAKQFALRKEQYVDAHYMALVK